MVKLPASAMNRSSCGPISHRPGRAKAFCCSGHTLVAPCFDPNRYPPWRYQGSGIMDQESPRPRDKWTGNLIVQLLRELAALENPGMAVRLVGHSAGDQFVERFAGFHSVGAARLIAANPASVLMPGRDDGYPY